MQNRTADLLLTMETLYRLSYRGKRIKDTRKSPRTSSARPESTGGNTISSLAGGVIGGWAGWKSDVCPGGTRPSSGGLPRRYPPRGARPGPQRVEAPGRSGRRRPRPTSSQQQHGRRRENEPQQDRKRRARRNPEKRRRHSASGTSQENETTKRDHATPPTEQVRKTKPRNVGVWGARPPTADARNTVVPCTTNAPVRVAGEGFEPP